MDTNRTVRAINKVKDDYIYSDFEKSSSTSGLEDRRKQKRSITISCGDDHTKQRRKRLRKSDDASKVERQRIRRTAKTSDESEEENKRRRQKRAGATMSAKLILREQERLRQIKSRDQRSEEEKIQEREGGREFFLWLSPLFERRSTVLGRFKLSLCSIVSVDSGFTIAISASVTDAILKT